MFSCQTYEGGFGGLPALEAHGGYSFCGLAALVLLGKEALCDLDLLLVIILLFKSADSLSLSLCVGESFLLSI